MRAVARSARPMALPTGSEIGFARPQSVLCHVCVPYGCRDALLKVAEDVVQERVAGDGRWQAVVQVPRLADARAHADGGLVMPVVRDWEAPAAGLRLVG
jgi:hypothetical protein